MPGRRPRSVNFGDALDSKAAQVSGDSTDDTPADVSSTMPDDVPDDVPGDVSGPIAGDMRSDMRADMSGDKLDDVFSQYAGARESASLRVRKISILVTDAQRDALERWIARAGSAVPGRVTASDVGMHLFDELVSDPTLTRRVLEKLIAGTK